MGGAGRRTAREPAAPPAVLHVRAPRRGRPAWLRPASALRCGLLIAAWVAGRAEVPAAETVAALIARAGNAAEEAPRLAAMRSLETRAEELGLDAATRAELTALTAVAAAWAEGRDRAAAEVARGAGEAHRYLHGFFNNATRPFEPAFPAAPRAESPLRPLWALYRGRFLAWFMIEHSEVSAVPARKALFVAEAERCLDLARQAFPENPLLAMYAGERVAVPGLSAADAAAPAWANDQRRALEQLHAIIRWWIAERQLANGEFGGNWGDDVEMWRWWAAVLIGFDDPVVNGAQARLARGNLARPALAAGYTSQLTDVEHTAEETADTLTPMLHAAGTNGEWAERARRLVTLAERVWWGENARGRRQFRHIDFNHERVGPDPGRAYDTGYHVRALQPALLLWQRTGDLALAASLLPWLRTWAEAARGTDRGKPAGLVPAALHWPSGRVGSETRGWIGPDLGRDPMQAQYSWPGYAATAMAAALLQAHTLAGEPELIEPLRRMAAMRRAHLAAGDPEGPEGSPAWAGRRLPSVLGDALAKWRQWSGDPEFDDLLAREAGGYLRFLLTGDEGPLGRELTATAAALSVNRAMFTSEVRYTDRVLAFPGAWPRAVAGGAGRVDARLLYSVVTGDPGMVENFPLNGVRWHTEPREIAVRVTENRRDGFAAEVFHFGATPRPLAASLWLLAAGDYTWRLTDAAGAELAQGRWTLGPTARRIAVELPPGRLCRLQVRRAR